MTKLSILNCGAFRFNFDLVHLQLYLGNNYDQMQWLHSHWRNYHDNTTLVHAGANTLLFSGKHIITLSFFSTGRIVKFHALSSIWIKCPLPQKASAITRIKIRWIDRLVTWTYKMHKEIRGENSVFQSGHWCIIYIFLLVGIIIFPSSVLTNC